MLVTASHRTKILRKLGHLQATSMDRPDIIRRTVGRKDGRDGSFRSTRERNSNLTEFSAKRTPFFSFRLFRLIFSC